MLKDPHRQFLDYLESHQLKCTTQRLLVLDVMLNSDRHLTVEETHVIAREFDDGIGLTTVYRTLKLLVEAGLVLSHRYKNDVIHYERADTSKHHDHIICQECGEVLEVVDDDIEKLQEKLAKRHGYALYSHRLYMYGVCPACLDREEE